MADKIVKAFEALRGHYLLLESIANAPQPSSQQPAAETSESPSGGKAKKDASLSPRERINFCNAVADYLPMQTVKNISEFPRLLTLAMELLLVCCDDKDADVRFVAGECINKIMKAFLDSNIGRIQVELYKEIKKNGPSRSLRAALQRFGDTCYLIRAHKCRPYIANMLPCIVKIAKRTDDSVQEVLGTMMSKLCPILGMFMNEHDIKILLKSFLPNLKSASASTRRVAASTLNTICHCSRKPAHFYSWLINMLLASITPLTNDLSSHTVLGALLCFRHIFPNLAECCEEKHTMKDSFGARAKKNETVITKDLILEKKQFHQIYEVTMFCTKHLDHNIVTAALENLIQILSSKAKAMLEILLSRDGIAPTITGPVNLLVLSKKFDAGISDDSMSVSSMELAEKVTEKLDDLSLTDSEHALDDDNALFSTIPDIKGQGGDTEELDISGVEEIDIVNETELLEDNEVERQLPLSIPANFDDRDGVDDETVFKESRFGTNISDIPDHDSLASFEEHPNDTSASDISAIIELQFNFDPVTCTGVPILHCVRLLCSFLLNGEPGHTLPDNRARVSVKSLALNCISLAIRLHPEAIYPKVIPNAIADASDAEVSEQLIRDIILLKEHGDPQIRGSISNIIGSFIFAGMQVSGGDFDQWNISIGEQYFTGRVDMLDYIKILMNMFSDESALVIKHTCLAVKTCINILCHSTYDLCGYELVRSLLNLSNSSYWLIKVEIMEVFQILDYHLMSILELLWIKERKISNVNCKFMCLQEQFIGNVLMEMLSDEDARVRFSAATCCAKVAANLCCIPTKGNDVSSHKSLHSSNMHFMIPVVEWGKQKYENKNTLARNLSYLIRKITEQLHGTTTKYLTHGCTQCLYLLSERYPVIKFPLSWEVLSSMQQQLKLAKSPSVIQSHNTFVPVSNDAFVKPTSSYGLQYVILDLISSTWMTLDLQAHTEALKLCVHLLCGASKYFLQKKKEKNVVNDSVADIPGGWSSIEDTELMLHANKLFIHIMRLLSVMTYVVEQTNPLLVSQKVPNSTPVKDKEKPSNSGRDSPASQASQPPPQNLTPQNPESPRKFSITKALQKKQDSVTEESKSNTANVPTPEGKQSSTGSLPSGQQTEKSERLGIFQQDAHLMKLYDVLKGSFKNYQVSSVPRSQDKFCSFMRGVLESFGLLMELATFNELGGHAEEILEYLKLTVCVEEEASLLAVQQLLKGLFGTNAASQPETYELPCSTKYLVETLGDPTFYQDSNLPINSYSDIYSNYIGLYGEGFLKSYNDFCLSLKLVPQVDVSVEKGGALNFLRFIKKNVVSNRPTAKVSKERVSSIQSYIRLFEPLVIHALKSYTTTSSIQLQCQAIHLLDQLIRLRVNYSLLDSEQVFIGFVLKQFEFIENGQISQPELFITTIFQFLVLLSYECFQHKHSQAKAIVSMPRIIQLCNDVMACGLPAIMYAVPALKPIVQDLFASQSQARPDSSKDLDTQREVVVSMLLRVTQYPEILNLLTQVLNGSKSDEVKWKRLSRQVADVVLPSLSKLDVNLISMNSLLLLFNLLDSVAPLALRPADIILKPLFGAVLPVTAVEVVRYISTVIALMRTLIMQNSEDIIFSRIQQLDISLIRSCFSMNKEEKFPLVVTKIESNAAHYLASFLIYVLDVTIDKLLENIYDLSTDKKQLYMLAEIIKLYFDLLVYLFKCGSFKKLSKSLVTLLFTEMEPNSGNNSTALKGDGSNTSPNSLSLVKVITDKLSAVKSWEPLMFLKWVYVVRSCEISDIEFWGEFNNSWTNGREHNVNENSSLWKEGFIRHGSLIVYCDITVSKLKEQKIIDAAVIGELLKGNMKDLMYLLTELPVKELVSRIIQQPELTALFIEGLSRLVSRNFSVVRPTMLKLILALLESIDLTYSSGVVHLLLTILPKITVYGLSRKAETLACRRLEIEYIQSLENEGNELATTELLAFFQHKVHSKRYPRFCALIQRITKKNTPAELTTSHPLALESVLVDINKYKVNEEWMYSFVQTLCFSEDDISHSSVHLLRSLELDHIQKIMLEDKFNIGLLEICIEEAFSSEQHLRSQSRNLSSPSPFRLELVSIYDTVGSTEAENKERLLNLSKQIVLTHINGILCKCKDEEIYNNVQYFSYKKEELKTLGGNPEQLQYYLIFIKCLSKLLQQSSSYNQTWNMTEEEANSILEYVLILPLVCAQELNHLKANIMVLELCFQSFSLILHCEEFRKCLSKEEYAYVLVNTISSIHKIVEELTLEQGEFSGTDSQSIFNASGMDNSQNTITPDETLADQTTNVFQKACLQISSLIHSLRDTLSYSSCTRSCLPYILVQPLRKVITGLARLSIVNSFTRIPPIVWKFGWQPVVEGPFLTELPPLPVDILKEKDVLEEFIFRVNHIGWTSRMQFEETWAALLGVLSSIPIVDEISCDEEIELAQSSSLVVHCITSLLLDTMLSPSPGNAAVSQYSVMHRQKDYPFLGSKPGKKLVAVRNEIELQFCDLILSNEGKKHKMLVYPVVPNLLSSKQRKQFLQYGCMMKRRLYISNLELPIDLRIFNLGQVSAASIRTRLITSDTQEDTDSEDSDSLIIALNERHSASSFNLPSDLFRKLEELDIRSCLQFLLELFEQWLSPNAHPRTPLMLKMEAIKSLCVLSDLFLELNHYEWILGILLEFSQTHPVEDEITTEYFVPTMCKALAVLKLEGNTAERVCKQVEMYLKSPHVPLQVSCMVGSLYILETSVNATLLVLVPILTEYVTKKLSSQQDSTTIVSQRYKMVFWSLTFYLMENCSSENQDNQFPVLVLETTLNELKKSTGESSPAFLHILFQGLERLVVSFSLTRQECDEVAKVAANWVYHGSTRMVLSALGLLCTCIYTGKDSDQASGLVSADIVIDSPMTESRLVVMEIINILLSRIRKGQLSEAVLLATILPRILLDFLPVHEVMNKLIAEFLSSQQPRPELIAKIFNKVSDLVYKESEASLVCEWVFLSIGSFVQRTPLCMAVWSLTCFFISASTNPWLKSIFPFTVERKGKLESKDKEIFCIAALDFYLNQNLNLTQREQFLQTFRSKSEALPSSPYESLINCCMHAIS